MVEAADTWHHSLTESSCFYRPCTAYQPQLVLVPWKHANLSGWLFWPQAIDYTPSRLECHWNTGGDQILHPGSVLIPHRFNQTHLPPPPLAFCRVEMGSDCCCGFSKQKWTCFYYELGQSGIHFISKIFSQWVCEECFFAWLTMQLVEEEGGCCYVTLCCLISLLFMFTLWLSQQLSRGWALWSPTVHCRAALVWHASLLIFFSFFSLSRSVEVKELEAIRKEEENAFNMNSDS